MWKSFSEPDISLFEGQMGIALALVKYSQKIENETIVDFVDILLEKIITKLDTCTSISFASGLAGIGWGLEYLIQNEFIEEVNTDIFDYIDQNIMRIDPRRIWDLSIEDGFEGLLHYILIHIQGAHDQKTDKPFDSIYLSDISNICLRLNGKKISTTLKLLIYKYLAFVKNNTLINYKINLLDFSTAISDFHKSELTKYPLGLHEGLSGLLMHSIYE